MIPALVMCVIMVMVVGVMRMGVIVGTGHGVAFRKIVAGNAT